MTPTAVHFGQAPAQFIGRHQVLATAYAAHLERFVRGAPQPPALPTQVWINRPEPAEKAGCDTGERHQTCTNGVPNPLTHSKTPSSSYAPKHKPSATRRSFARQDDWLARDGIISCEAAVTKSRSMERVITVVGSFAEADAADRAYWLTRTPLDRLRHLERLRRLNYGERAAERLQRVLELAQRPPG